ncbi:MAG TPA: phosphoribosylglycinamide formyltransferase [Gemmatimonadaceae bacterium]|nr:phosphoribosylglycinamide formyltransferase [Gemmatimonadaceae bacterium]
MTVRIAVLASGRGSNLKALIDHFSKLGEHAPAAIELVASNRPGAPALDRARAAGIAAESFNAGDDGSALIEILERHAIDLVVLAGYMKHIPAPVISRWNNRMINVHPGLLPEFGGAGMYGARVHTAVIERKAPATGVTVHLVDEEFDHGPIVAQWKIPVLPGESAESLAERVLEVEHIVYPRAVEMVATLIGRKIFANL